MITRFTMTGADNSVQPAELLTLQREFPFVEWGILCSRSSQGNSRFPSFDWLLTLAHYQRALQQTGEKLNLSCHMCGAWVREILVGNNSFVTELTPFVWSVFDRVQLNTHGVRHKASDSAFDELTVLFPGKEFIFQYDDVNAHLLELGQEYGVNYSTLFDLSHGAGVLPSEWPDVISDTKCGYAGGLSPENLKEQIERIEAIAGDTAIWIDMETHVRSNNDRQFDLDKVRQCLEIASPYIVVTT